VDSIGSNASKLADELPDTLLCQESFIPLFSMYRQYGNFEHHFGSISRFLCISQPNPTANRKLTVCYALPGAHAFRVLIGACNLMVCPTPVFRGLADSLLSLAHGSYCGTADPQAANFLYACEDMLILRAIRAAWASHFKGR